MNRTDIVAKIKESLHEVFPESLGLDVNAETILDDIPGWDSMASVNLQMQLESAFACSVPAEFLSGETPIGDIVEHIESATHAQAH